MMSVRIFFFSSLIAVVTAANTQPGFAKEYNLTTFKSQQLTATYYSEGANIADINGDGQTDVVHGPYWFAGPDFNSKHEIYPAKPQPTSGYANNFFSWVYDFDQDGRQDVISVGLPGSPAVIYHNPGKDGFDKHWPQHVVLGGIGSESPQFLDLVGDARPELICIRDGQFGYATPDWNHPLKTWSFQPVSDVKGPAHGLGLGDINGDGRQDILFKLGWLEQPKTLEGNWNYHRFTFDDYGGADMFAYDVDGDGDNDVITSLKAHSYGLAWFEQVKQDDQISFQKHLIMGDHPSQNKYGLLFTEPHSVNLVDIDGDGLKDIITGKTYWSHHKSSPMWDAGAVVYWFKLVRTKEGVDWVPFQADGDSGIGRQLVVGDINGDHSPDIIIGGMKGCHVLTQQRKTVDEKTWLAAQPKPVKIAPPPVVNNSGEQRRGPQSYRNRTTGLVSGALEGETLQFSHTGGHARPQAMKSFPADKWSNNAHLWWTHANPGDQLTVEIPVEQAGKYRLETVLTCARDYAIVQLSLNGQELGKPIDLFHPDVITTGVLNLGQHELKAGSNKLTMEISGANKQAVRSYMVGIDYVRIVPVGKTAIDGFPALGKDGKPLNLDFETGTLKDWTAEGKAFAGQPIKGDTISKRRKDMYSRHQGDYWIGGFELVGDQPTGKLTSASFQVTYPWATFLLGGGSSKWSRVELVDKLSGEAFYQVVGNNREDMRRVIVDLRKHLGKEIFIRLIDQQDEGWGHLNFDNFLFHSEQPGEPVKSHVALALDEYPHAGLSAEEAVKNMKLPPGFNAKVFATEPDIKQPIAMALDERGRVWIAEAYEYPRRAPEGKGKDRILILEDVDGDGKFDSRKVFAENLNLVSGLEVGFGGVWVGAAPYFMFIPDRDQDDTPDGPPEILLDGWGYHDTHETLNAFIWGPDGWLYGCHGVFTHSLVGKPGTPKEKRTPLNAAIWRYHPTRHQFDLFAKGTSNPWGVDFNDHGQAFCTACVIPHLFHIIQGARYQRQAGQHFNQYTYDDIKTIADHLHYVGAWAHAGNNRSDSVGGGHAHAGAMIYLGDVWPKKYRNQIFMNNIHGQRLNMDVLKPNGSGYTGSHGPDFLLTGDKASQMLNLRYGPDGQAYVIDWYDMNACHHRQYDRHDRSNGRIYKISYGDTKPVNIDLRSKDDLELAEYVLHKNDWYVRHSRKVLQERAAQRALDPEAIIGLVNVLTKHPDETRRLRAFWTLHATGNLNAELVEQKLQDQNPYVRGWAIQLALESAVIPIESLLPHLEEMAKSDASQVVRLYLASAAQKIPVENRWTLLEQLTSHPEDATDHNLPLMYWYAAEPLASEDPDRALDFALSSGQNFPRLRDFMLRRIGSDDSSSSLDVLVRALQKTDSPNLQLIFLSSLQKALQGQSQPIAPMGWPEAWIKLKNSENKDVQLEAAALATLFGNEAAKARLLTVASKQGNDKHRQKAVETLLKVKEAGLVPILHSLAPDTKWGSLAIKGLAQYEDPHTATLLLSIYPKLSPENKRHALATLSARASYGLALLKAIEKGEIPKTALSADLVRQLDHHQTDEISSLLTAMWGTVNETPEELKKQIAQYKELINNPKGPKPDPSLGRAVFVTTCNRCHILYGEGGKVGPDLTGSNRSNLDYILSNIVDPSSVMAKEYQPSTIITDDGRVVAGIIRAEDEKSITVQSANETLVIPKDTIEEQVLSKKSMMPDNQLKQFSPHQIRSLVAYLRDKKQVPILATPENATMFFNGQDLTGWRGEKGLWSVQNGEIVGKSKGMKHNSFLVSDLVAEHFRLSLEVKLVDDKGNSGIQFRSEMRTLRELKGYQADIGPGWWGKLYEEHGRNLLWEKSGEQFVKKGDWNTYVIEAKGHQIKTWINGKPCVELDDPRGALRGKFALQLHSGGPTEVRFRKIKLEPLSSNSP